MAMTIRLLGAAGITTAAITPLYTVPGTPVLGAIVNNIRVANLAGGAVQINLWYAPSGTPPGQGVRILDWNKSIPGIDILVVKPEFTMGPGDRIDLVTTGTPNLEYVVSGTERTL